MTVFTEAQLGELRNRGIELDRVRVARIDFHQSGPLRFMPKWLNPQDYAPPKIETPKTLYCPVIEIGDFHLVIVLPDGELRHIQKTDGRQIQ